MSRRARLAVALVSVLSGVAVGAALGGVAGLHQLQLNRYGELGLDRAAADWLARCVQRGAAGAGLSAALFGAAAALAMGARRWRWRLLAAPALAVPAAYAFYALYNRLPDEGALYYADLLRRRSVWSALGLSCAGVSALAAAWRPQLSQALGVAAALAAAALLLAAALPGLRRTAPPPAAPDVLFLVVDALRADHVGAYGYARPTTPFIDSLAQRGALFERAYAPANLTRMSVPSYFASVYPSVHGIRGRDQYADPALLMIAEILKQHGYDTGAWMPNPSLQFFYRFHYGFDVYYDMDAVLPRWRDESLPMHRRWETAESIRRSVLEWLDARRDIERPVFAYLHYRDVHAPYVAPPRYNAMFETLERPSRPLPEGLFQRRNWAYLKLSDDGNDLSHYRMRYDAEIRYTDDQIRELFDALEQRGRLRNTLVILTADHGEAFLEHDQLDHGHTLYEELVRVPLIVVPPGDAPQPRRLEGLTELIDLAPTILDYVGAAAPASFQGQSLRPRIEARPGARARDVVFVEGPEWVAARNDRWKVHIRRSSGEARLYNLEQDPGEQRPIPRDVWPEEAAGLAERLERHIRLASVGRGRSGRLEADVQQQLEALGYVE